MIFTVIDLLSFAFYIINVITIIIIEKYQVRRPADPSRNLLFKIRLLHGITAINRNEDGAT